jgi:hypothetical protein
MKRKLMVALLVLSPGLGIGGCRTTQVSSGGGTTMPSTPAEAGLVPAGSTMQVVLDQPLGADTSHVGERFTARVQQPLRTPSGTVVVPEGSIVSGQVTELKRSEHVGDQAAIKVDFDSIRVAGRQSPLEAKVVDTEVKGGNGENTGRAATGAGIGAAGGVVLGAILGGGLGGAALGGLLGAGAGTAIGLGTGETNPRLPAGTVLSLQVTSATRVAKVKTPAPG